MRKVFTISLLVVLLIVGILVWAWMSAPPWPERLADVRLEPTRPILRPEQVTPDNAFYYIRNLTNFANLPRLYSATNEYERFASMGWTKGAYTQLESIVAEDAEAFALYRKAADITQCQLVTMTSFTCMVPYVSVVLEQCKALRFDAEWAAGRGDWRTARSDFQAILRVSDHLSRGGALIDILVNIAGQTIACQGLRRVAVQRNPTERFLRDMSALLLDLDLHREPLAEAMRYERLAAQDVLRMIRDARVQELASLSDGPNRPVRWIKAAGQSGLLRNTPAHFDAAYSRIIVDASAPYVSGRSFADVVPPLDVTSPLQRIGMMMDDPIGRILVNLLVPALDKTKEQYVGARALVRGTALFLAVRAYQADHHGKPPAALSELVPAYLDALPEDPFGKNHSPFLYSVSGVEWTIYSVGPNQKNDKGIYDWANPDDKSKHRDQLDICFSPGQVQREQDEYLKKHTN